MYIGHGVRLADSKKIFHKVLSKFKIPLLQLE